MQVWVHWQEQKAIILWQGGEDEETQIASMALAPNLPLFSVPSNAIIIASMSV